MRRNRSDHESPRPRFRSNEWASAEDGLTKRELFAALAMQALVNRNGYVGHPGEQDKMTANMARHAVLYADALIKALNARE